MRSVSFSIVNTILNNESQHKPIFPLIRLACYISMEPDPADPNIGSVRQFKDLIKEDLIKFCNKPCLDTADSLHRNYQKLLSKQQIDPALPFNLNIFFSKDLPNLIKQYKKPSINQQIKLQLSNNFWQLLNNFVPQYNYYLIAEISYWKNPIIYANLNEGGDLLEIYKILDPKNKVLIHFLNLELLLDQKIFNCFRFSIELKAELFGLLMKLQNLSSENLNHLEKITLELADLYIKTTQIENDILSLNILLLNNNLSEIELSNTAYNHQSQPKLTAKINQQLVQTQRQLTENNQYLKKTLNLRNNFANLNQIHELKEYLHPINSFFSASLTFYSPWRSSQFIAEQLYTVLKKIPHQHTLSFNILLQPNLLGSNSIQQSIGIIKTIEHIYFVDPKIGNFQFRIEELDLFKEFTAWELYSNGYCHMFNQVKFKNIFLLEYLNIKFIESKPSNYQFLKQYWPNNNKILNFINYSRDLINYANTILFAFNVNKNYFFEKFDPKGSNKKLKSFIQFKKSQAKQVRLW